MSAALSRAVAPAIDGLAPRDVYHTLLAHGPEADELAGRFLCRQLAQLPPRRTELPRAPRRLYRWSVRNWRRTARAYRRYLAERQLGAPRRLFGSRAHALYFLRGVAPTKLVDGAWLYGCLHCRADERFRGLIRTYLEELGEGEPALNHVLLYQRLLRQLGCAPERPLSQAHYLPGAIQLAFARQPRRFLPELLGYNLGYEQLPLHVPITAYELRELGLDARYFILHLTVDNSASGHGRKAVEAVRALLPDSAEARARLEAGFRLNELGASTHSVVAEFDLQAELLAALRDKAVFGVGLHSDHCRIAGLSVNQWLARPERLADFLQALQQEGWVRRGRDPAHSRFWRLIEGERAAMQGVFTPWERALIHDWIADGHESARWAAPAGDSAPSRRGQADAAPAASAEDMASLVALMRPGRHHSPEGLAATAAFAREFGT
ncbi:iron-containing redox enzyme family protein [Alkalilimnicola sp. S0819]|uniref:iron-containing redox enzyme family protein n=1 Tax=Alkalilimnicola sp. S0819 TaxID=2613922 RepID=UPI001261854D|nr:iron-containing redox enzyme family protein [Alkalilimnicola sp. S0819]KAB7624301.1 iron-containing redox enzyme family protein [Alkalilimnicola sp. S0819]MPQ16125.1 iron-containing redox enzyme family protein [Alkalilimnicola sp. S0819]